MGTRRLLRCVPLAASIGCQGARWAPLAATSSAQAWSQLPQVTHPLLQQPWGYISSRCSSSGSSKSSSGSSNSYGGFDSANCSSGSSAATSTQSRGVNRLQRSPAQLVQQQRQFSFSLQQPIEPIEVFFSGCSWFFVYHAGVAQALMDARVPVKAW